MTGAFYIDDVDIYAKYGVVITDSGYNDLLCFPALKDPEYNDWPEEDGIEVDLDAPALEAKEVTISFARNYPDAGDFIYMISRPGYHTLRITELDKEWRLRLVTQTSNKDYSCAVTFSLKFADDFPGRSENYTPACGSGLRLPVSEYKLDGRPFSQYGIEVIGGWDDLLKHPSLKQNLTRSFAASDGQIYDADHVVFSSKETTLKCSLSTVSTGKFWECYTAFFNDLIQPGERLLYWDYTNEEYPCYYKKSSGFKIVSLHGRIVVEFNLTLVFTVIKIKETEYLLASEDGFFIETEDGEYLIDLN